MQWAKTLLAATTGKFVQVYQHGIDCQNQTSARQTVPVLRPMPGPITGKV
jgi:hypothetical protein